MVVRSLPDVDNAVMGDLEGMNDKCDAELPPLSERGCCEPTGESSGTPALGLKEDLRDVLANDSSPELVLRETTSSS